MKRNKEMEKERNEEGKKELQKNVKILNSKHQTKYQLNKKRTKLKKAQKLKQNRNKQKYNQLNQKIKNF